MIHPVAYIKRINASCTRLVQNPSLSAAVRLPTSQQFMSIYKKWPIRGYVDAENVNYRLMCNWTNKCPFDSLITWEDNLSIGFLTFWLLTLHNKIPVDHSKEGARSNCFPLYAAVDSFVISKTCNQNPSKCLTLMDSLSMRSSEGG